MKNLQVTPKTLALILVVVVCSLGMVGWFGLVSAQRHHADELAAQVADAQVNLDALQTPATSGSGHAKATKGSAKQAAKEKAAQQAQLQAAFPRALQMPSILLQVQHIATRMHVSLESFAPSVPTAMSGYDSYPINITVNGRYRDVQRFVHALRTQAGSTRGRVHADGRLFAVESVNLTPAPDGLPQLAAAIVIDAFVYSGVVPATATDPATTTDGSEAQTTTTSEGTS
jgi:Tfp pilus assembly protein PilO